jgi:hypothetical protein
MLAATAERRPHAYGFVVLHRAGVRFLFRHANFREKIEDHFTLYF